MKKLLLTLLAAGLVSSLPVHADPIVEQSDFHHNNRSLIHSDSSNISDKGQLLVIPPHPSAGAESLLRDQRFHRYPAAESNAGTASKEVGGLHSREVNFADGRGLTQYRGESNQLHQQRGQLLLQRSTVFSARQNNWQAIKPYVPGADSRARQALLYYVQGNSTGAGFQVKDPSFKRNWTLRMAHTPKVVAQPDGSFLAQVPCFGSYEGSSLVSSVIVQYSIKGTSPKFNFSTPVVVSADRQLRPGQKIMAGVYHEAPPTNLVHGRQHRSN